MAYESTGINELDNTNFLIYPNPAKDVLTIQAENNQLPITIKLINAIGETVKTELINSTTHSINVEEFLNGIYYLQLENKVGTSSKKIIITK